MKSIIFILSFLFTFSVWGQTIKTIQHDGLTRQYREYVPTSYTGTQPVPLVICLHGLGDNMTSFSGIGIHQLADSAQFITLYLQAENSPLGTAWNSGAGYYGITLNDQVDDLGFISALIDTVAAGYNIDLTRVYATGFSMGGFMCNRLACQLANKITAVASVAGTMGNYLSSNPYRAIPYAHFHGTADSSVYYVGNMYGNDAEEVVEYWVNYNECDTPAVMTPLPDIASDGMTIERYDYLNGNQGSEVVFYKVYNAPHTWLMAGTNDISYTVEIWNFFKRFQHTSLLIEEQTESQISLYPNPASDFIQVNCFNMSAGEFFELYDINGRILLSQGYDGTYFQIDLRELQSGIYMLRVISNGSCHTVNFIKN